MPRFTRFWTSALIAAAIGTIAVPSAGQFFFPPGVANPGADVDITDELDATHLIGPGGVIHLVWVSETDVTNSSGPDPDLFYSKLPPGGTWSLPELVNTYGAIDGVGLEQAPRCALGAGADLHCVWQSQSPLGGSGGDWDVFYARRSPAGWEPTEIVNVEPAASTNNDVAPEVFVRPDGLVIVAWQTEGFDGADQDIVARNRGSQSWGAVSLVNRAGDLGDDLGPVAMVEGLFDEVLAFWSSNESSSPVFGNIGSDFDLLRNGFGDAGWGNADTWTYFFRDDSGDDFGVAASAWDRGDFGPEWHIVWQSNESFLDPLGIGTDWDIFHLNSAGGLPRVVNAGAAADLGDDVDPSVCVERGGTVHVSWTSDSDLAGTAADPDVFHAVRAAQVGSWSATALLGVNGLFDAAVDQSPEIRCSSGSLLSGLWSSTDPAGGVGSDYDLFHALGVLTGLERGYEPLLEIGDLHPRLALHVDGTVKVFRATTVFGGELPRISDLDGRLFPLGSTWVAPAGRIVDLDFAIEEDGTVHAVWSSEADPTGFLGADTDIWYAQAPLGGEFAAEEIVDVNAMADGVVFGNDDDLRPRLVIDGSGTPHVVWLDDVDPVTGRGRLVHSRRNGSSWSAPVVIHAQVAADVPADFSVAVTAIGEPVVAWTSAYDFNGTGSDADIFVSRLSGSTWTSPEAVGPANIDALDDTGPSITIDGSDWFVVWSATETGVETDLRMSEGDGTSWSAAVPLLDFFANDTGNDEAPTAVAHDGRLHVAWQSSEPLYFGMAGTDVDLFYVELDLSDPAARGALPRLVNPDAFQDRPGSPPELRDLVVDPWGTPWFAWNTGYVDFALTSQISTFSEIGGGLFADDFESGGTGSWSSTVP